MNGDRHLMKRKIAKWIGIMACAIALLAAWIWEAEEEAGRAAALSTVYFTVEFRREVGHWPKDIAELQTRIPMRSAVELRGLELIIRSSGPEQAEVWISYLAHGKRRELHAVITPTNYPRR